MYVIVNHRRVSLVKVLETSIYWWDRTPDLVVVSPMPRPLRYGGALGAGSLSVLHILLPTSHATFPTVICPLSCQFCGHSPLCQTGSWTYATLSKFLWTFAFLSDCTWTYAVLSYECNSGPIKDWDVPFDFDSNVVYFPIVFVCISSK